MLKPPVKNIFGQVRDTFNFLHRIGLENREFTIISDNCWGGLVYKHFAMEYRSPFANLFLFPPCYLRLLQDFENNVDLELRFIEPSSSRYAETMRERKSLDTYPVGVLGESIELHFLHYRDKADIRLKWNKRKKRINLNNIMFKFSDRDNPSPELICQFDELPFKNKVCFSEKPYPYKSVVKLKDFHLKKFLNTLQR
jgi:uncharacterized protein (DUF1919 family)